MKNKTAFKLSLYFGIALSIFAIIIGFTFSYLFRRQTIETRKSELLGRAQSIAENTADYLESIYRNGMGNGFGGYIRSLNDIAGADAWIIDENKNLITAGNMHGMLNENKIITYSDLPADADQIISEVFQNKNVFSEDFSDILKKATLTVGVPVKNSQNQVIAVVLLHSPVVGMNDAINTGTHILLISLFAGLILSFLLSLWLSRNFTTPILQKEAEDAIRLDKIRNNFVTNITHELKTPVTVIRGSLEALTDKVVTDPEKVDDYHQQMLKEAIQLQRLIGDLLDLSKLQNTDFIMDFQKVSFFEILNEAVRGATYLAKDKNITIGLETDHDFAFNGDYGRIRQMLMIVLDNAIKFSPENSRIEVVLSNRLLFIKDYGPGISKEDIPYIFERFFKARTEDNKTGTGLGLAIAKQIADRHGIRLTVASEEGKGTNFTFQF